MDIPVNIDDKTGSEDTEMEIEEVDTEEEQEPQIQQKKIKKELRKWGSSSASKPPRPEVSGTKRKSKYWLILLTRLMKGLSNANIAVS